MVPNEATNYKERNPTILEKNELFELEFMKQWNLKCVP